mgnify:CR=1 FL=1
MRTTRRNLIKMTTYAIIFRKLPLSGLLHVA